MPIPPLPTRNNIYRGTFLQEIVNQIRGIGSVLNPTGLPDAPDGDSPINTDSGWYYAILQQLKHIGDNIKPSAVAVSESYLKNADGVQTVLDAASYDRIVFIHVNVSEAFADGSGTQPVFTIGETDAADKFSDGTDLDDAALGTSLFFSGVLSQGADLEIDATAATGTATGAIAVSVQAAPVAQ